MRHAAACFSLAADWQPPLVEVKYALRTPAEGVSCLVEIKAKTGRQVFSKEARPCRAAFVGASTCSVTDCNCAVRCL